MDKRQSIIRTQVEHNFTITPNAIARNQNLTHAAKGLLLQMLSYPNDWAFNLRHLSNHSKSGLHATRSAFEELQAAGYVTRALRRDDNGHILGYEYTVTNDPTVVRFSDNGESHATNTETTNTEKSLQSKALVEKMAEHRPTRASATPTSEIELIIQAWNDNRGTLPKVTAINPQRKRRILSVIKEHNGEAVDIIADATKNVAPNAYWQENRYTLDNLLAGGKYLGHAEAYRHAQTTQTPITTEVPF